MVEAGLGLVKSVAKDRDRPFRASCLAVAAVACCPACLSCRRSSGVEHSLGKGGAGGSIPPGGTIFLFRNSLGV